MNGEQIIFWFVEELEMYQIRGRYLGAICLSAIILMSVGSRQVFGMAEEQIGNQPLNEFNYQEHKDALRVINHKSRVYHTWVNGNEHFYYQGDTETLNDILSKFADIKAEVHEVIIRPGPGQTKTFDGKVIKYAWLLHINGGIARHLTTIDKGAMIWSKYPQMTVYVGDGGIDLKKIRIPKGVTVVEIDDLSKRYTKALSSSDKTVRGWGCGQLAGLDLYSEKNAAVVTKMLDDENAWVRLNAVGALARFGKTATPALAKLRELLKISDENLSRQIEEAIGKIENAKLDEKKVKNHHKTLKQIQKFRKRQEKQNPATVG